MSRGDHVPNADRRVSLGLGLFIVREIARAHGGGVTVESTAEAGTILTVRIDLATVLEDATRQVAGSYRHSQLLENCG